MYRLRSLVILLSIMLVISSCGSGGGSYTGWQELDQNYYYSGTDLGVQYDAVNQIASFKLWAPTADKVSLQFYQASDANTKQGGPIVLTKDVSAGVWSTSVTAVDLGVTQLKGLFYSYLVDGRTALDPYARSMAENNGSTGKAAIIDPNEVAVTGFASISGYSKREDAIIYEMHVRDFTVDPTLGYSPFGTFTAFIQKLNYLQSLGVTHIQLMPVMAYYYGNEALNQTREWTWSSIGNNYNWGYDPQNYFSPDGMYANNPYDPQERVNELKQLIQAIHDHGMGVILDVVYNHTPVRSIFDNIVPDYYYRDRNDSGAGDDIATERRMVRKLIVDSLSYWTQEYKVDGFRFDLMGLIDAQTVADGYAAVSAINPNTLFIGEGWRMYGGPPMEMADQDWVLKQDYAAVFSDDMRNIIKSGYGSEGSPKFITNGPQDIQTVFSNVKGQPTQNFTTDDPGDAVQYLAAHDNLTLHDVIALATHKNPTNATDEEEIQKRIRLGNGIILTSQGIAFLHGGQEYGRTKRWGTTGVPPESTQDPVTGVVYIHNSYDSSDRINHFDWSAVDNAGVAQDTMTYTRGLIALRRSTDAFRLGSQALVNSNVTQIASPSIAATDLVLAFRATDSTNSNNYFVFVNADDQSRTISLATDLTSGSVLVDGASAGTSPIASPVGVSISTNSITLDPLTMGVIQQ